MLLTEKYKKQIYYQFPKDFLCVSADAGHHPQHIAVHRRNGDAEGDGGDGPRCVLPHAGQGEKALIGVGEHPAEVLRHLTGGFLEVAGAVVVAQALPQLHEPVLLHGRQIGHGGQHEAVDRYQILEFLNIDNGEIELNGQSLISSTQDNGISTQRGAFDYLLDLETWA